jgi:hypothetical protein
MKVVAAGNRGSDLPSEVVIRMPAYSGSKFNVTDGQEYVVYAMALWLGGIIIMILDDLQRPHWYPVELFRISDSTVPRWWSFGYVREPTGAFDPQAFWGYRSLIDDPGHHAALIDRKIEALRAFLNECDVTDLPPDELRKIETLRITAS